MQFPTTLLSEFNTIEHNLELEEYIRERGNLLIQQPCWFGPSSSFFFQKAKNPATKEQICCCSFLTFFLSHFIVNCCSFLYQKQAKANNIPQAKQVKNISLVRTSEFYRGRDGVCYASCQKEKADAIHFVFNFFGWCYFFKTGLGILINKKYERAFFLLQDLTDCLGQIWFSISIQKV